MKYAAFAIAVALVTAGAADARDRGGNGGGNRGGGDRSVTVERDVDRDNGTATGSVSVQGANGHGYTREFTRDGSVGNRAANGTVTTNAGGTGTTQGSVVCRDGVCSRDGVVVGANGATASVDSIATRHAPGIWRAETTRTGARGQQNTTRRWFRFGRD